MKTNLEKLNVPYIEAIHGSDADDVINKVAAWCESDYAVKMFFGQLLRLMSLAAYLTAYSTDTVEHEWVICRPRVWRRWRDKQARRAGWKTYHWLHRLEKWISLSPSYYIFCGALWAYLTAYSTDTVEHEWVICRRTGMRLKKEADGRVFIYRRGMSWQNFRSTLSALNMKGTL